MGDRVVGIDTHIVMVPSPAGPVETPVYSPFDGKITEGCCETVVIGGRAAATRDSVARNAPPHIPPVGVFKTPPSNTGRVSRGSMSVFIGGKPAARSGDTATTCNEPAVEDSATVVAKSTVFIG
ncbi:PAAR domain-containing protein [Streptomyces wuyuanensis]|uniref:PAAR domain-containing protein n=1 Tax=Streptomyces wuyuanensis TaxID=1196353 RepID=UPI0034312771